MSEIFEEQHFVMEASASDLMIVNMSGLILGGIILFFVFIKISIWLSLGFVLILALYMYADYLIWTCRGIRSVVVDNQGISVFRGLGREITRIDQTQITGIDIFSKMNRKTVNILTGGTSVKLPGITFFGGSRLRITNDAFDDRQFDAFILLISQFSSKGQSPG